MDSTSIASTASEPSPTEIEGWAHSPGGADTKPALLKHTTDAS